MSTAYPNPVAPAAPSDCPTPAAQSTPSMTDRLKEKAAHLGDKAQEMGSGAKDAVQHKLEQAKEAAHHQLDHAKDSATQYMEQGREKATELTHRVEDYVRREPTKSLLAAAGVGFVLGFLLIRR